MGSGLLSTTGRTALCEVAIDRAAPKRFCDACLLRASGECSELLLEHPNGDLKCAIMRVVSALRALNRRAAFDVIDGDMVIDR